MSTLATVALYIAGGLVVTSVGIVGAVALAGAWAANPARTRTAVGAATRPRQGRRRGFGAATADGLHEWVTWPDRHPPAPPVPRPRRPPRPRPVSPPRPVNWWDDLDDDPPPPLTPPPAPSGGTTEEKPMSWTPQDTSTGSNGSSSNGSGTATEAPQGATFESLPALAAYLRDEPAQLEEIAAELNARLANLRSITDRLEGWYPALDLATQLHEIEEAVPETDSLTGLIEAVTSAAATAGAHEDAYEEAPSDGASGDIGRFSGE